MYTILLNANKQLIVTKREVIIQKSNLVDKIRFLIPMTIGDNNIGDFSAVHVEYVTPVSQTYYNELLTADMELYNDTHYQYIVPVDTHLTDEAGDIEVQLSFYKIEMTADGEIEGKVFKTSGCTIQVIPINNLQQFIPDKSLLGVDQRILKLIATEEGLAARQEQIEAKQDEIEHTISTIIDDENISEKTTYSSKKIEEKFIDDEEVDEELEEREIGTEDIDEMFDEDTVNEELANAEPINQGDIDEMFDDDDKDKTTPSIDDDIDTVAGEEVTDITNAEIDDMFNGDDEVDDEI